MNTTKRLSRPALNTAALLLVAYFAAGCASISTGAHYDETMNFGAYKRFAWIDEQPHIVGAEETGIIISPLTQTKIQAAIRAELERKGFSFVENDADADFVVAYTVGTRNEVSVESYPQSYHGTWGWHVRGSHYYVNEVTTHSYTRGTLGVDVFDRKSRKPVWHGWAEKTITTGDKEDPGPTIEAGVSQMLELFPSPS